MFESLIGFYVIPFFDFFRFWELCNYDTTAKRGGRFPFSFRIVLPKFLSHEVALAMLCGNEGFPFFVYFIKKLPPRRTSRV